MICSLSNEKKKKEVKGELIEEVEKKKKRRHSSATKKDRAAIHCGGSQDREGRTPDFQKGKKKLEGT